MSEMTESATTSSGDLILPSMTELYERSDIEYLWKFWEALATGVDAR